MLICKAEGFRRTCVPHPKTTKFLKGYKVTDDKIKELLTEATGAKSNDVLMSKISDQLKSAEQRSLKLLDELEIICHKKLKQVSITDVEAEFTASRLLKILRFRLIMQGDLHILPQITPEEILESGRPVLQPKS